QRPRSGISSPHCPRMGRRHDPPRQGWAAHKNGPGARPGPPDTHERRSEMTTPTITELALAARRRLAATGWHVDTIDEITEDNGTAKEIVLRHREHPERLIVRTHLDGSVTITAEQD